MIDQSRTSCVCETVGTEIHQRKDRVSNQPSYDTRSVMGRCSLMVHSRSLVLRIYVLELVQPPDDNMGSPEPRRVTPCPRCVSQDGVSNRTVGLLLGGTRFIHGRDGSKKDRQSLDRRIRQKCGPV